MTWVCVECYEQLGIEFEIYTIPNWFQVQCEVCKIEVAEHLVAKDKMEIQLGTKHDAISLIIHTGIIGES